HSIVLDLEGVDTVADIFINDIRIGHTENMFRRYQFAVKEQLKPGENTVRIVVRGAEKVACERAKQLPYPIPHSSFPVQSPHRNLLRKVQCHGGWDWGPCLMVSGISHHVRLLGVDDIKLDYVLCRQYHDAHQCRLEFELEYEAVVKGLFPLEVCIGDQQTVEEVNVTPGHHKHRLSITIPNPRLWWPAGEGEQYLYDLRVRFGSATFSQKIGLREIQVLYPDDEHGRAFIIQINGRKIFAKGADWIPADALPGRVTRERMADLLDSAVAANMNILRVWGGGQYEDEAFYELCDERGLLIWQDFMFACGLYPATPNFLAEVKAEVIHQVKRLMNYACIALWCGNNENLGALGWYQESRENRDRYLVDYDRLNEGTIGDTVRELDPDRCFWPSSPCAGPHDYTNTFHDPSKGDMHYWGVWHGSKPFESYLEIVPRFCSEFGFQSFPSLATIASFAPRSEWNPTSPVMEHHQRCRDGNTKILTTMCRYFRVPRDFENFVYLSQLQQALAIRMGVEHWRRLRPICMGTVIWQLNDNWPVASWATLEYSGKWKLIHYLTRRFYAPILPSILQKGTVLTCWLTSDHAEGCKGTLRLEVYNLEGERVAECKWPVALEQAGSIEAGTFDLAESGLLPDQVFALLHVEENGTIHTNFHLTAKPKEYTFPDPKISFRVIPGHDHRHWTISLKCQHPAFFVFLDTLEISGRFSDNGLILLPDREVEVSFTTQEPTTVEALTGDLSIYHLQGSYS
ncbi:MAG: glycoside hydrolase family 2 protein, partial [Lentisphaerae bacterium]